MSRYRDNIETFSFNVAGGYLIAEFNKMVKPGEGNADLSWAIAANIDTEFNFTISIRMYFYKIINVMFCAFYCDPGTYLLSRKMEITSST